MRRGDDSNPFFQIPFSFLQNHLQVRRPEGLSDEKRREISDLQLNDDLARLF